MLSLTKKSLMTVIGVTSAALMGVVGCSSDDSSNPGGGSGDDGGTINDDGGSSGDGSTTGDGGTGGDGSTGGTTVKTGSVTFTQNSFTGGTIYSNSGTAFFYELPSGTDLDCAGYTTIATPAAATTSCTIKVCTVPVTPSDAGTTVDAGDAGPVVSPNSGDITLKTAVSSTGIVLTAKSDGTYSVATGTTKWWDSSDATGEVKSNGSASSIAAFDDTALLTPGDVTTPKLGDTDVSAAIPATPAFDRGTPLAVTYSGGIATTKVNVRLTTTSTAKKAIIDCNFDAANGSNSIAAADLGNLDKAGSAGVSGTYSVQDQTVKATSASGYNFNVTLGANSHSGTFTNSN